MAELGRATATVSGVVPADDKLELDRLAFRASRVLGRPVTRSEVVAWGVAALLGRANPLFRPSGLLRPGDAGLNVMELPEMPEPAAASA